MNRYLVSLDKFANKEQIRFYKKWNDCVRRAWSRTDQRLTRVSAGYYLVRVGNQLHTIYKNGNNRDWMVQEANANDSDLWNGTLADYRDYVFN